MVKWCDPFRKGDKRDQRQLMGSKEDNPLSHAGLISFRMKGDWLRQMSTQGKAPLSASMMKIKIEAYAFTPETI